MDRIDMLPTPHLSPDCPIGARLMEHGCTDLADALRWIRALRYGPNTRWGDAQVLFEDGQGTCVTKHGLAARLAAELGLPIHRYEGLYRQDATIRPAIAPVLARYGWPYIPQMHCFLQYGPTRVDLTEGNAHGKARLPDQYDMIVRVAPDPTEAERDAVYAWGLEGLRRIDPFWRDKTDAAIAEARAACIEAIAEEGRAAVQ